MTEPNRDVSEAWKIDVVALLKAHGRISILAAAAVAVLVGVGGFVYMRFIQPVTRQVSLEFRPTFLAADKMEYPNGLPFSSSDVTAASVIDQVWTTAEVKPYCAPEPFRAGFFVEQRSDDSVWLDLEYQALLGQPRLDPVERRQLQDEHAAKRRALPIQYRLVFSLPSECASIPNAVLVKAMSIVLPTWATESETKRGVLKYQVTVLSPTTLDVTSEGPGGWVIGADQLRSALERIILNVEEVAKIPGAVQVRLNPAPDAAGGAGAAAPAGVDRLTFWELRGKLDDLLRAQLEPLVMTSGRALARESFAWINEAVASAEREQKSAENRAKKYQEGLQQYSGTSAPMDARLAAAPAGSNRDAGQAPMPLIDQSFIDRIIQMSGMTAGFRQALTQQMVTANLDAVRAQNRADYYKRLQSLRDSGGASISADDLKKRLEEIKAEGKMLTRQFGELYDQFSRVALRPAGGLYQSEKPVAFDENRAFTRRSLLQLVAAAFMAMMVVVFGFLVVRERLALERR